MAAGQWYCQAHDRVLISNIQFYLPIETDAAALCICSRPSNLKMPSNRTTDKAQVTTFAQSARTTLTTRMSYGNTQRKTIMHVRNAVRSVPLAELNSLASLSGDDTHPYGHHSYSTATRNFRTTTVTSTVTGLPSRQTFSARPTTATAPSPRTLWSRGSNTWLPSIRIVERTIGLSVQFLAILHRD